MSSEEGTQQRYFCHQCNTTCIPNPPDFLCPTCNEGFIEPVTSPAPPQHSDIRVNSMAGLFDDLYGFNVMDTSNRARFNMEALQSLALQSTASTLGGRSSTPPTTTSTSRSPASSSSPSNSAPSNSAPSNSAPSNSAPSNSAPSNSAPSNSAPSNSAPSYSGPSHNAPSSTARARLGGHSHRIHTSHVHPSSGNPPQHTLFPGMSAGTSRFRFVLGDSLGGDGNTDVPTLFSMIMSGLNGDQQTVVGNPGDYAWGPTGLDNIISQLIGQLDGSGPPPAQETTIDSLPEVYVPRKHIENKLDCTVCQEYFTEDVKVKELPCSHYFHIDCIVPWLKLHNSCPICRDSIDGRQQQDVPMDDVSIVETESIPDLEDRPTDILRPAPLPPPPPPPASSTSASTSQTIHEDDLD